MRSPTSWRDRPVELHEAVALEALVAEQEHAPGAEAAGPPRRRRGLHVIGGDDAGEGPGRRGIELVRLPLLGAGQELRQTDRRRAGADLHEPRFVGDRERDRGRAGVELPDVGDRAGVLHRLARVLGRLVRIPADSVAARRRVVGGREVHLVVAHPAAGVAQRQLLGVDDALRLVGARALKREAGEDRERVARNGAPAALLLPAAGRGHERHGACGGQQGFQERARQGDRDRGGAILTSPVRCPDGPAYCRACSQARVTLPIRIRWGWSPTGTWATSAPVL